MGGDPVHDHNMYWPPEQVTQFLKLMRPLLDACDMHDVGLSPGETTNWYRFAEWGYADAIAEDPEALRAGAVGAACFGRTRTTGRPSTQKPGPSG